MRHLFLLLLGAPNLLLLLLLFCIAADTVAKSPGAQDDVRPPLSSSDAAARAGIIVLKTLSLQSLFQCHRCRLIVLAMVSRFLSYMHLPIAPHKSMSAYV